jgi:hypothetical protein
MISAEGYLTSVQNLVSIRGGHENFTPTLCSFEVECHILYSL